MNFWIGLKRAVGVAVLAFVACGGEATKRPGTSGSTDAGAGSRSTAGAPLGAISAGANASSSAGAASAGHPTGGMAQVSGGVPAAGGDDGGATASAGSPEQAGGGAGGTSDCPILECATSCPGERWLGLDACPTCACAPPAAQLTYVDFACPSTALSLTATSSYYIGGVDRWVIDFEWKCKTPSLGGPVRAKLQVRLVLPPPTPIDATHRTFYLVSPQAPKEYEPFLAFVYLQGSGVPEIAVSLLHSSSFLSIRREGDELVGGIDYVGQASSGASETKLAGAFRVPVPTF